MDTNTAIQSNIYQVGFTGVEWPFSKSLCSPKAPAVHLQKVSFLLTQRPCLIQMALMPVRSWSHKVALHKAVLLLSEWQAHIGHARALIRYRVFFQDLHHGSAGMLTLPMAPANWEALKKAKQNPFVLDITKHYCLAQVNSFLKEHVFSSCHLTAWPWFPMTDH